MAAQAITWTLALTLTVFLPRYLGAANVGKLHLASSIWGIMTIMIRFGTDILLIKEIARAPEKTAELIGTSNVVRTVFFFISLGVVILYVDSTGYPPETHWIIYIVGIAIFFTELAGSYQAALQGLERMEYYSLSDVLSKAVTTILTIVLLLSGYKVIMVASVMILGALVGWGVQYYAVRRFQPLNFRFSLDKAAWLLKAGLPYLMVSGFLVLYTQLDVIILSLILNEESIGWYGTANRLFGTLLFVPTVFITAVFPVLSRLYSDESSNLKTLLQKSFDLLFLLSIPIGFGVFVTAPNLVVLLYGEEFTNSGPILALMGIALIFMYQNILLGRYIISIDRQNVWTVIMAVATVLTVPLDLILIPWCNLQFGNGALGGAISFVITEAGMLFVGLLFLPRGTLGRKNVGLALRVIFAGLVMVATTWALRFEFILIPIGVGGVTYVAMILLLRVIPKEDWVLIRSILQNLLVRFRKPPTKISTGL
jgi:O-antigen/teichoic acid export membrane protein